MKRVFLAVFLASMAVFLSTGNSAKATHPAFISFSPGLHTLSGTQNSVVVEMPSDGATATIEVIRQDTLDIVERQTIIDDDDVDFQATFTWTEPDTTLTYPYKYRYVEYDVYSPILFTIARETSIDCSEETDGQAFVVDDASDWRTSLDRYTFRRGDYIPFYVCVDSPAGWTLDVEDSPTTTAFQLQLEDNYGSGEFFSLPIITQTGASQSEQTLEVTLDGAYGFQTNLRWQLRDTFTELSDTTLDAHEPDHNGITGLWDEAYGDFQVNSAVDKAELVSSGALSSDSFTDASGTIVTSHDDDQSSAWLLDGTSTDNDILGNRLRMTTEAAGDTIGVVYQGTSGTDYHAQVTVTFPDVIVGGGTTLRGGIVLRWNPSTNRGISCVVDAENDTLAIYDANTDTATSAILASTALSSAVTNGSVYRISFFEGADNFRCWTNGGIIVSVSSAIETAITNSGLIVFDNDGANAGSIYFDDWFVSDYYDSLAVVEGNADVQEDVYVELTVGSRAAGVGYCRFEDDFWVVSIDPITDYVWSFKRLGLNVQSVTAASLTTAPGDEVTIRVEINSSDRHTIYVNGTQYLQFTSACVTFRDGYGIYSEGATDAEWDNFRIASDTVTTVYPKTTTMKAFLISENGENFNLSVPTELEADVPLSVNVSVSDSDIYESFSTARVADLDSGAGSRSLEAAYTRNQVIDLGLSDINGTIRLMLADSNLSAFADDDYALFVDISYSVVPDSALGNFNILLHSYGWNDPMGRIAFTLILMVFAFFGVISFIRSIDPDIETGSVFFFGFLGAVAAFIFSSAMGILPAAMVVVLGFFGVAMLFVMQGKNT